MLLLLVTACCALLCAAPATAATVVRYVDANGDDNANDCTDSGVPCLTIEHAINQANSGDEVRVAAGTYNVTQNLFQTVPIYLHGDPNGARPVVRGGGGLLYITSPGTTVRHMAFEATGTGFGPNGGVIDSEAGSGSVVLDDLSVTVDSAVALPAIGVFAGTGTVTLSNSVVSANTSTSHAAVWTASGQLVIRGTDISRTGPASSSAALGAEGGQTPAATLDAQNVTIETTANPCITLDPTSGAGTLIRDVTVTQDAPGAGNTQNSCLVVDRTSTFQGVTVNAPESQVVGSPVAGIGSGTVPAVGIGMISQSSSTNVLLQNLTVNTRGLGLAIGPVAGVQVRGGRFTGQYAGIESYGATGVISDAFVTGTDTNSYGITAAFGSSIKLRNLTAIGTGTRQAIYATDNGTAITVKNTIARGTGAGEDLGTEGTATMTVSYSNYVDSAQLGGTGGAITDTGGHQTGDPLFTNPALFDYHVLAGSPVIDAGTTDADLGATDIDGEARIQDSAPDIGADERAKPPAQPTDGGGGGGSTPPPPPDTTPTTTPTATPTPTGTQNIPGPVVTISAAAVKVTKTGVANIRIGCPATAAGSCTGTLTLQTAAPVSTAAKKKIVRLGTQAFKLGAGKQAFVGVKLSKQARKLLAKLKRLRVKAIANVHDANGAARITQRLLSLKLH